MKASFVLAGSLALFVAADLSLGARFLGSFTISLPHTFSAGTPARASDVNENFAAIVSAVETRAVEVDGRLDDLAPAENMVSVATSGTGFTSVAAALASITDASATNPYVVQVGPGIFDETSLCSVPSFVTLRGSGRAATIVRSARTSASVDEASATVSLATDAELQDLRVENAGLSQMSSAIYGEDLSSDTRLFNVAASVEGNGGTHHVAVHVGDSDLLIESCELTASGATTSNVAFQSRDTGAAFAQPVLHGSTLLGLDVTNGVGADVNLTALNVDSCTIRGDSVGILATTNGTTTVLNSTVRTSGLSQVYEQTGAAAILSGSTRLIGGNPVGTASQFKYAHCMKGNLDVIVNGQGSTVQ